MALPRMSTKVPVRVPHRRACWALGAVACALAGCSAEADIPRVIFEQTNLQFDGVPEVPVDLPLDETQRIETQFDHPGDINLPGDVELYATAARITARDGMSDLSFIEGIELTLASRAEGAPEPQLFATYARPEGSGPVSVVNLSTNEDFNILDFLETEGAYYRIAAWGTLPRENWTVDVMVELRGSLALE